MSVSLGTPSYLHLMSLSDKPRTLEMKRWQSVFLAGLGMNMTQSQIIASKSGLILSFTAIALRDIKKPKSIDKKLSPLKAQEKLREEPTTAVTFLPA